MTTIDLDALDQLLILCLAGDTDAALAVSRQVAALAELLTPATGAPIDTVTEVLRDYPGEMFSARQLAGEIVARLGLVGEPGAVSYWA